jgi:hypothetical protein
VPHSRSTAQAERTPHVLYGLVRCALDHPGSTDQGANTAAIVALKKRCDVSFPQQHFENIARRREVTN